MKIIIVIVFLLDSSNCQVSFLDQKFNPLFRLGRTTLYDLTKPSTFEHGYRINLKRGVSFIFHHLHKKEKFKYYKFVENSNTCEVCNYN